MPSDLAEGRGAPSRRLRRSYEAGHHPKFLVLVDDREECGKAVYYAGRRASRVGAEMLLLRVIPSFWDEVPLLGVADVMRTEAQKEARQVIHQFEVLARNVSGKSPESLIREGDPAREIFELIQADEDIAMLVLAAGASTEGPGPLISELARTAGSYPVPVVIVPAHLTDAELDALS